MSYEELKAHAEEIKQLAIDKSVEMGIQATAGAAAYGASPPIGYLQDTAEKMFAGTEGCFDDWIGLPDPTVIGMGTTSAENAVSDLGAEQYLTNDTAKTYAGGAGTNLAIKGLEPTAAFMQGWQSGTATNYALFAELFGPISSNLSLCAGVLRGALEAEGELFKRTREDVDGLAHATIDALKHCTDKSPDDVKLAITLVGAVAGIVAVPFTAGGSLAASYTFAAIAGGTALGGEFVPDEEEKESAIKGNTPSEIVQSLYDNLKTLNEDLTTAEGKVRTALTDSASNFSAALALPPGQSPVKMPRPTLADNPTLGGHDG